MSTIFIISDTKKKIQKCHREMKFFFHEVILFVENEYELKIEKIKI